MTMKYLHTMVRVTDLDASLKFYCDALGLRELRRKDHPQGRFTLVFLAAPGDDEAQVELTHNWDPETYGIGRAFGHLAYEVDDIYATCRRLQEHGVRAEIADGSLPQGRDDVLGLVAGSAGFDWPASKSRSSCARMRAIRSLIPVNGAM